MNNPNPINENCSTCSSTASNKNRLWLFVQHISTQSNTVTANNAEYSAIQSKHDPHFDQLCCKLRMHSTPSKIAKNNFDHYNARMHLLFIN